MYGTNYNGLGAWYDSLVDAGMNLAKEYIPAVTSGAQQACSIVSNPAAAGIASNLLTNTVGSSASSYITKAASAASGACSTMFPQKGAVTAPTAVVPKAGTQATTTAAPTKKKQYPAGTLYYFDPKARMFMVSLPIGAGLGCVGGDCMMGLGQYAMFPGGWGALGADVTNQPPTPVAEEPTSPAVATTKAVVEKASGTTPFYKKWWFWTAAGAGALALGGGGYFLLRPKHA
jgi:hypothetical protein